MRTVYPSKIDASLLLVLIAAMAASLAAAFKAWQAGSATAWAVAAFLVATGVGLPLWLLLSTRYTLQDRQLLVQSGPFRWRIAVASITGVTPTSSLLSSPALSLDRLRIDHGRRQSLMVSPRDQAGFIRDLEAARREAR